MPPLMNENATTKNTNLFLNSELLSRAKELKIDLSATVERALEKELQAFERNNWLEDNRKGIYLLNKLSETKGLFSNNYRTF